MLIAVPAEGYVYGERVRNYKSHSAESSNGSLETKSDFGGINVRITTAASAPEHIADAAKSAKATGMATGACDKLSAERRTPKSGTRFGNTVSIMWFAERRTPKSGIRFGHAVPVSVFAARRKPKSGKRFGNIDPVLILFVVVTTLRLGGR